MGLRGAGMLGQDRMLFALEFTIGGIEGVREVEDNHSFLSLVLFFKLRTL